MQHITTAMFTLVITAMMITLSHSSSTDGVCYTEGSRLVVQHLTRQETYSTSCGWWGRRCRRTRTIPYTENVMETFMQRICCSGYTDDAGVCRRVEIGFERSTYSVNEDAGSVTVCAALLHEVQMEPSRIVPLTTSTVSGTAQGYWDFTQFAASRSFSSSNRRFCFSININYDYLHEGVESFQVRLRGQNLPSYVHLTRPTTTVQIHNIHRVKIGFERSSYYVNEDAGVVTVCAALQSVRNMESGRSLVVTFRTVSGSAQSGTDFTSFTATRSFSRSISRLCFDISINYDYIYESTQSFQVRLMGQNLPSYVSLTRPSTTVRIRNRYKIEIGFEQASQLVREDAGSASVCLRILNPRYGTIARINYGLIFQTQQNRAPNGALTSHDFQQVMQQVTLSSSSRRQCVNVPIIHDNDHEATETFTATLTRQPSLPSYVTINPSTTTVEILNTRRTAIGFEHTSLSVAEDAGSISACISLLHLSTSDSRRTLQVRVGTLTGTAANSALSPSDFTFSPTTVVLSSRVRRRCCSIAIMSDNIYELPEYFTVTLNRTNSLPSSVLLSPNALSIRIDNRHRVTIGFESPSYTVNEDAGNVTVCVTIRLNNGQNVSSLLGSDLYRMDIRTRENSATASEDFFHSSAIVTLSSSSTRACTDVPIIYDAVFEGTESFSVTLHVNAVPGYVTLQPQSAVVNIRHVNGMLIGFERTRLFALETSGIVGVCVQVTFPINPFAPIPDLNYNVAMATQSGTGPNGAQVDQDFHPLSSVITLTSTVRIQCARIHIVPDNMRESPETFTIHLNRSSSLPSYVGLSPDTATVTIYDP